MMKMMCSFFNKGSVDIEMETLTAKIAHKNTH